jgi:predicted extracellular nuclease
VTEVHGIVTAVLDSQTFIFQDAKGDGDNSTSDALVVFTGIGGSSSTTTSVSVGDLVSVSGTVAEYTPSSSTGQWLSTTQIGNNPTVTVVSSNNTLPEPILIGGPTGRMPPTARMSDGVAFYESLEFMRVTLVDPTSVSATNQYGELFVVVADQDGGVHATGLSPRGTLNIAPDDFNPERVQIDTQKTFSGNITTPMVNVGATLSSVTGILRYVIVIHRTYAHAAAFPSFPLNESKHFAPIIHEMAQLRVWQF